MIADDEVCQIREGCQIRKKAQAGEGNPQGTLQMCS